ncbi:hypothetical protein QVD17_15944 [Tagetes erecta]|uniref:Uncharacterized protein n=1 Tax=Tagetes erecta TaxID=13708 RepID=A0AAD8P047_TARER|nr:hypothetical protein QVD17_15944 [Tagetes erecta]
MATTTRNLADQLATIAARLDVILASLKADVEEIKVQMIGDGCSIEESNGGLRNTVAEESQESKHDPLHQLGSKTDYVNKTSGVSGIAGCYNALFQVQLIYKRICPDSFTNKANWTMIFVCSSRTSHFLKTIVAYTAKLTSSASYNSHL